MKHFRPFEIEALRALGTPILGEAVVAAVVQDSAFVSYDHSGVGYFLTVGHPLLPVERLVLHKPVVYGRVEDISGSYLAFVENHELMLEFAGNTDVPDNFRDLNVQIEVDASVT